MRQVVGQALALTRANLEEARRSVLDLRAAPLEGRTLVDAVSQLNGVVTSLNTTISPLQGATDRLGRLVDRLPQGRRRVIDSPGPYA